MTPEAAVGGLAEIIAARSEFTEDDLYAAMAEAGVPDGVADRAYTFTQRAKRGHPGTSTDRLGSYV